MCGFGAALAGAPGISSAALQPGMCRRSGEFTSPWRRPDRIGTGPAAATVCRPKGRLYGRGLPRSQALYARAGRKHGARRARMTSLAQILIEQPRFQQQFVTSWRAKRREPQRRRSAPRTLRILRCRANQGSGKGMGTSVSGLQFGPDGANRDEPQVSTCGRQDPRSPSTLTGLSAGKVGPSGAGRCSRLGFP